MVEMAQQSHKTAYAVVALVIIVVALIGTGVINPQTLQIGQSNQGGGGQQVAPVQQIPTSGSSFVGQLLWGVVHRDALDNAEARTEGTNVVTTPYKSTDGITYSALGVTSVTAGNTVPLTIDSSMNSVMYVGVQVPSGQSFFVAPTATSDRTLNSRILDFDFKDVTNDGVKEWIFKLDLKNMPQPVAGQTGSTLVMYILSYDTSASTLNAPTDISAVGITAGVQTFIRWEQSVVAEKADAVYEYEVKVNTTDTARFDRGNTILSIPNIGDISLSDFVESQDGTNTIYKYTLGASLKKANFVTTPQNGNTVHPIPLKYVSNFSVAGQEQLITLTLRSITASQGTSTVLDQIKLSA